MATYTTNILVKEYSTRAYLHYGTDIFAADANFIIFIDALILVAEQIIDEYCLVPTLFFSAAGLRQSAEYLDSNGSGKFFSKYRPIISISELVTNVNKPNEGTNWRTMTAGPGGGTDYLVDTDEGEFQIYDSQEIPPRGNLRSIRLDYIPGYAAVPVVVAHTCKEMVANALNAVLNNLINPRELAQVHMDRDALFDLAMHDLGLTENQKWNLRKYKSRQRYRYY